MSVPKIMALRMGVYVILLGYLICDLFVFTGPIYKTLNSSPRDEKTVIAEAKASGVVARVYYRPIYRAQVEEAMREFLWRRGRTAAEAGPAELRLLRDLIVQQLIDEELLKLQIKVSTAEEVAVSDSEIDRAVKIDLTRYPDSSVFDSLIGKARWKGEEEHRMRIAARIQRADYLEQRVPDDITEEEAQAWFNENKKAFPADFEESKASIIAALSLDKRDVMWKEFRYQKLRRYAEGKIDLFDDVLHAEEGEE
jgi:hypothetical protein